MRLRFKVASAIVAPMVTMLVAEARAARAAGDGMAGGTEQPRAKVSVTPELGTRATCSRPEV